MKKILPFGIALGVVVFALAASNAATSLFGLLEEGAVLASKILRSQTPAWNAVKLAALSPTVKESEWVEGTKLWEETVGAVVAVGTVECPSTRLNVLVDSETPDFIAAYKVAITGKKAQGTAYMTLARKSDKWTLTHLNVTSPAFSKLNRKQVDGAESFIKEFLQSFSRTGATENLIQYADASLAKQLKEGGLATSTYAIAGGQFSGRLKSCGRTRFGAITLFRSQRLYSFETPVKFVDGRSTSIMSTLVKSGSKWRLHSFYVRDPLT